jgi:hypothetical protein
MDEKKGLTQELINELKEKYGEIYKVKLGEQDYVYRPMKRVEYKSVVGNPDATRTFSEEQIVQKCVVYPTINSTTLAAEKAGTVSTLTDLIMVASNFGVTEEPVKL